MSASPRPLFHELDQVLVRPWHDETVDQIGHDPRSRYVERFWLGLLGPSVVCFLRHVADRFEAAPLGFELDIGLCATSIGLGIPRGPNASFPRMLNRCRQFKMVTVVGPTTIAVRRMLPPLNYKQVLKLAPQLQAQHERWIDTAPGAAEVAELGDKARRLALSLLQLGEDPAAAERQLRTWRFHPALAREALSWAVERHNRPRQDPAATDSSQEARTRTDAR